MSPQFYFVFWRYDLATTIEIELDATNHVATIVTQKKMYLVPEEFRKSMAFKHNPQWGGEMSNYGDNNMLTERHSIQLPTDTNFEENSIVREDYATCYGLVAEFKFEKRLVGSTHLKSKLRWNVLLEGAQEGKGFETVLEQSLASAKSTSSNFQ